MKKVDLTVFTQEDIIKKIGKEWMLITAGNAEKANTMTASWGGAGWLWNKPVAFLFVRPERFTHEFLEREERLTLSFFAEEKRKALQICGTHSGRDTDKFSEAGITPIALDSGSITFAEAEMTLDCHKLFKTEMTEESFLDKSILEQWYKGAHGGGLHTVYIAEIDSVYSKE